MAPSGHDCKNAELDVKPQPRQTKALFQTGIAVRFDNMIAFIGLENCLPLTNTAINMQVNLRNQNYIAE